MTVLSSIVVSATSRCAVRTARARRSPQEKFPRPNPEAVSDPLHRTEGEIAIAALDRTQVRPVNAEDAREALLRKPALDAKTPHVSANDSL